jgi:hypothetical protein
MYQSQRRDVLKAASFPTKKFMGDPNRMQRKKMVAAPVLEASTN